MTTQCKTIERLATYIWNNGGKSGNLRFAEMNQVNAISSESLRAWMIYYCPRYAWTETMNGYRFYYESQRRGDFCGRLHIEKIED